MYGGPSSKLGRGGGPKRLRNSFPPPPRHRPPSSANSRLSLGGSANKPPPAVEETFSLVSGSNPPAFSMIIRLAPDLVEEIKRVEAQGGTARMKFDPNPNNPNGNIIDLGGKEFRFTWSRDGDLCDIYEQRQSGVDGNGLLVESGCAWRKVNVQRILDESTKNRVKMRSEEAERKLKSRKAIVLEPGNPSMKSQSKALAAVEATSWKNYTKKKEASLKKKKAETLQVGGPSKTTQRSGLMSTSATAKGKCSSPLTSSPDHFAPSSSPRGALNNSKSLDDAVPSQMTDKQDTNAVAEKEIPTRTSNVMRNKPGGKGNNGSKPIDLQSMLTSLLKDKPNGMTFKALEKAVSDKLPNSIKDLDTIIKRIAKYHPPGKYILKTAMDLESSKKPQTESGSSPEENHNQTPAREEFHNQTSAPHGGVEEKVPNDDLVETIQVKSPVEEESNTLEKIDIQHASPDIFGDKKGSDFSEGRAGSSSASGSDSDSESNSSDSGSDSGSHSRSRSRSPAGSGSGSSSDSESDASSTSKEGLEGSDEDVDIMSDDEKEPKHKAEACDQMMSLPIPVKSPDGRSVQNEVDEKQDGNESDAVDIEKDSPEGHEATMMVTADTISDKVGKNAEETKPFSPDYQQLQERKNYIGSLFDERESEFKDSSRNDQFDSSDRLSKGKHKRGPELKNIDEKSERAKRLKAGNSARESYSPGTDVQMFGNSRNFSPYEFTEDTGKGPNTQVGNRADRQGNSNLGFQKGYNRALPGKSSSDLPQTGQRSFDQSPLGNPSYPLEKSDQPGEKIRHNRKHSGKDFRAREVSNVPENKSQRDAQNGDIYATEKKVPRNSRDGSNGSKQSLLSMDSNFQRQGEMVGKLKEDRQGTLSHLGTSPKDNNRTGVNKSPAVNGRGISLQRELSDLELGELRESTPDETIVAKQFERKGSFKHMENKANTSEDVNSNIAKVKPSLKATLDSGRPISVLSSGFPSNLENTNKKNVDCHFEESTKSRSRVMQTQSQPLKADNADIGSQNNLTEMSTKFRNSESGVSHGIDLDGRRESNRRVPANGSKQGTKRGMVSSPVKESKRRRPNSGEEVPEGRKGSVFVDRSNGDQKKRESSSDENSCSYSKFEKEEPELKGPIKTFSQYKEYVQEYQDKYQSYLSLHKILMDYRDEFNKLGVDLENAERSGNQDRYDGIAAQIMESYRRCGSRHMRLKKIFLVIHEELLSAKQRIKDFADWYRDRD
ncbi:dentin sialophosphoprotein-like [Trifolium pratense]|uniref:dentin sialophosphoprotein-like n=1 Tax=Trifolium pratense TaxID=57577 RepID=UPI001E690A09|nr:dentin sialophosphoprotein-like [Trifolium pratense]